MKLLLDTHALLWWLADLDLEPHARAAIEDPDNLVVVSAASVWEIAIKRSLGKLRTGSDLLGAIGAAGFEPLAISLQHAEVAGSLPPHHRDPFDRMLIGQAQVQDLTIVTRDAAFEPYGTSLLAC